MISAKYCAFMKSRVRRYDGSDDVGNVRLTGEGDIVTALEDVLGVVEVVLVLRVAHANVATSTTRAEQRGLEGAVLLGEVGGLKSVVARLLGDLLELEPVEAVGGDEGE